jgi:flagellar biosynthetic protein FliR
LFEFVTYGAQKFQAFLLVLFRASGLFITAPAFSHKSLPPTIKIAMAVILAVLLVPVVSEIQLPEIDSIWILGALAAKEMLVGFIIGLFFSLLFIGVRMSGNIIGYQIGLLIAQVLDPEVNSNVSLVGEFLYGIALLIFLAIDGHHAIISAFVDSYKMVSLGQVSLSGPAGDLLIRFTAYAFTIAVKLAAPVMITLFLTSVTLGIVARTVPQMNIFIVGIPLKVGVGFLVMAAALPVFRYMLEKVVHYLDSEVSTVLHGLGVA